MSHPSAPQPRRTRRNTGALPAPINVWPAWLSAQPSRNPQHGSTVNAAVAARLLCTFTRPGELIVALDHQLAVAEAADWFARKATLIVTDSHQQEAVDRRIQPRLTPSRRAAVRVIAADAARRIQVLHASPGRTTMIIARVPEQPMPSGSRESPKTRMFELLDACDTALRPGGYLAAEVPSIDASGQFADHASDVIATAKALGLIYLQHLVVINSRLSETEAVAERQTPATSGGATGGTRQHIDLYLFQKPGVTNA